MSRTSLIFWSGLMIVVFLLATNAQVGAQTCTGAELPAEQYALVLDDIRLQSGAGLGTGASTMEANEEAAILETACEGGTTWYRVQSLRDGERTGWLEEAAIVLSDAGSTATTRVYGDTCYIQPTEIAIGEDHSLGDPISHLLAFEYETLGYAPVFLFQGKVVSDEDVFYEGQTMDNRVVFGLRARWVLRQSTHGIFGGETSKWNDPTNWQIIVDCEVVNAANGIEVTPEASLPRAAVKVII